MQAEAYKRTTSDKIAQVAPVTALASSCMLGAWRSNPYRDRRTERHLSMPLGCALRGSILINPSLQPNSARSSVCSARTSTAFSNPEPVVPAALPLSAAKDRQHGF